MFNRKKTQKNNQTEKLKTFGPPATLRLAMRAGRLIIISQVFGFFVYLISRKKFKKFIKDETKELKELASGQQNFKKFGKDSGALLKNLFIPNEDNSYRPKILRPKSLVALTLLAVSVKLVITGFLFFSYPTPAHLSLIISENIIALLNQSRTEAGFEPLVEDKILSGFAGQKASDMITRDYFSHDTPEGKRPWQWINRGEYDYIYAGENLAMDFITAESVHEAFMKSPSHRRNILNPKYKNVGIAVISGKLGGKDTTLLVQFFGARREDLGTLAKTQKLPLESAGESNIASQENPPASLPAPESLTVGSSNEGVIIVAAAQKTSKTLINALMEYSNVFFIAFLLFVLIAFLLNVFIKIKIQDASVILQSVAAIALLLSLVLVKFHFIEKIASQILIL